MGYIEKASLSLSEKLGDRLNKSSEEKKVLNYGLFIILHTGLGILATFCVGMFTGMVIEIMTISIVAAILKRYSGGVHSSSPERCIITGLIFSVTAAVVCKKLAILINSEKLVIFILIIFSYSYYEIYRKCPMPSKNKPLKNKKTRDKMRVKALRLMNILFISIILLCAIYYLKQIYLLKVVIISILLGLILQVFALTKLGAWIIGVLEEIFNFIHIN